MDNKSIPVIAIVGAGATGVTCLVQLIIKWRASQSSKRFKILLFDKSTFGPGLAYATGEHGHLLNTRARLMGIMPGEPMHFVEWMSSIESELETEFPELHVEPDSYPPRTLYGRYLSEMLEKFVGIASEEDITVKKIKAVITDADLDDDGRWRLSAKDEQTWNADYVVLATGNPKPSAFENLENKTNYISSPWPTNSLLGRVTNKSASIGIIGSSLTSIDCVISLVNNGHTGPICLFSKEGYLPRVQFRKEKDYERRILTLAAIRKIIRETGKPIRVVDLIRLFRKEVELASGKPVDWKSEDRTGKDARDLLIKDLEQAKAGESWFQQILYSLRYDAYEIWKLLRPDQKLLYTKWIKTFVDVNRHAIPLKNGEKLLQLFDKGQLSVLGNSQKIEPAGTRFVMKADDNKSWQADYVVNAAGPAAMISKMDDMPLLQSLLAKQLIQEYPAGGLMVDTRSLQILTGNKSRLHNLYAAGHPLLGLQLDVNALWFNVEQVDLLTNDIIRELA